MTTVASAADVTELDPSQSLTDAAYYRIREMILDGALPVGTSVSVVALAGQFGMSRSPVRSAIERLMSERLLARTAGGAAVAAPDRLHGGGDGGDGAGQIGWHRPLTPVGMDAPTSAPP